MSYKMFFALLKKTGQSKEDIILGFTEGRTSSLRDLSDRDYLRLISTMRNATSGRYDQRDAIRKAIISCFHQMHYEDAAAAAKNWAEKMGVGRGDEHIKRAFNEYSVGELMKLLKKAEVAVRDFQNALRERLKG